MSHIDEDFIDSIVNQCLTEDSGSAVAPHGQQGRSTPTGGAQRAGSHRSGAYPTPPDPSMNPPAVHNRSFDHLNGSTMNRSDVSGRGSFASPSPNHPRPSTTAGMSSHRQGGGDWGPEEHVMGGSGRAQEFHSSPNPHRAPTTADSTVRRIQLWEERKKTRQMIQQHEKMERELEECTFKPNTTMARTSVHLKKNIPASKAPGSATRGLTAQNLRMAGSSSAGGRTSDFNPDDQEIFAAQAKAQDLMAPSALYANNEAWGFNSFVSRQIYAREKKQEEEAAAAAVFALKNPDIIRREPTVPEPFQLGKSVHKGSIRSIHSKPTEEVAKKVRNANSKSFYADRLADGRIGKSSGGGLNSSGYAGSGSPAKFGNDYSGYSNNNYGDEDDSYHYSPNRSGGFSGGEDSSFYDPVLSRNFRGVDGDNDDDLGAKEVVAPSIPSGMFSMQASAIFASKAGIVKGSPGGGGRQTGYSPSTFQR